MNGWSRGTGNCPKDQGARSLEQGQSLPPKEGSTLGHVSCTQLYCSAPVIFGDLVPGPPQLLEGGSQWQSDTCLALCLAHIRLSEAVAELMLSIMFFFEVRHYYF